MVTMRDVAARAGVSQTTVSHVVNRSRFVRLETVTAVERAIKETGYVNDSVARSLRTGKTDMIALCISAITNPYFGNLVRNIERHLSVAGVGLLLVDTHDDADREYRVTTDVLARQPDGILLAPSASPEPTLDLIASREVPTVLVDRIPPWAPDDRFDAIGVENIRSMTELVGHLAGLGHRRIAHVTSQRGLYTTEERVTGFVQGAAAHPGVSDDLIVAGLVEGGVNEHAVDTLLERDRPPTAIVTGNNQVTIEVLRQLSERGLDVPADISLATFDDFDWTDLFHPRLTAVRQPIGELAQRAVELLQRRQSDPSAPGRVERIAPSLIVRDSARAPRDSTATRSDGRPDGWHGRAGPPPTNPGRSTSGW